MPAIVSVPTRSAPVSFLSTSKVTVLPLPLAPPVMVSHEAFDVAVHEQPADAVTVTVRPVDWFFPRLRLVELSEYEHPVF